MKKLLSILLAAVMLLTALPMIPASAETGEDTNNGVTPYSITVPESDGQEFSIDGGLTWQSSGTFTGLTPDTEYQIVARYAETEESMASPMSEPLTVRTKLASASVPAPSAPEFIRKTDTLIEVTAETGNEYSIDGGSSWQDGGVFDGLQPNTGYEIISRVKETESAMPSGGSPALNVTTKNSAPTAPESAPTFISKTDVAITVETVPGLEYSIDGAAWQDSGVFDGLQPNNDYEIISRVKETEDTMPSGSSPALNVTTKNSAPTAPESAPELISKTDIAIMVETVPGLEYSIDGETWQDSGVFDGLQPNTDYEIISRVKETESAMPSGSSPALNVTTKSSAPEAPAAPVLESRTDVEIRVKASEGQEYSIDNGETWQDSADFPGLISNTGYTILARIAETALSMPSAASPALTTSTKGAAPATPDRPILSQKTVDSILIKTVEGQEYSIDNGSTWQEGGAFTGLQPNASYQIICRVKETEDNMASEPSEPLMVTTSSEYTPLPPNLARAHSAYIYGYPDGTVRPEANITRAEAAAMFAAAFPDRMAQDYTSFFTDVDSSAWYYQQVESMHAAGLISGEKDGSYRPEDAITRAEFVAIAVRFLQKAEYSGSDFFSDTSDTWATAQINLAANAGLISGYNDGTFRPEASITRAEAMVIVNRLLGRNADCTTHNHLTSLWPDCQDTGAWYYAAVLEASVSHMFYTI